MAKAIKVVTPEARASFPALVEPEEGTNGRSARYKLSLLIPKDTDISDLKRAMNDACKELWGDTPPKKLKNPILDGDEYDTDGYAGNYLIRADTVDKPGCINSERKRIDNKDVYAGCYVKASLQAKAYDFTNDNGTPSRGVKFYLRNVMFIRDGEPFGSGPADPFEDFGVEEDPDSASEDFSASGDSTVVVDDTGSDPF